MNSKSTTKNKFCYLITLGNEIGFPCSQISLSSDDPLSDDEIRDNMIDENIIFITEVDYDSYYESISK